MNKFQKGLTYIMNKNNLLLLKKYLKEIYLYKNRKSSFSILIISIFRIGVVLIPPIYIMKIMDSAIPENSLSKIVTYTGIVMCFTIIDAVSSIVLEKSYSLLSKKVCVQYQKQCIEHMFNLGGSYLSNSSIGEKFTTIMSDVFQLQNLTSSTVFGFLSDTVTAIVMFAFLAYVQYDMLIVVICILPIIYFTQLYFQKKGKEKSNDVRDTQSALTGVLEAIVSNTLSCILSNATTYFFRKYETTIEEAENKSMESKLIYAKNSGLLSFLATFFTVLILGIGGLKVMQGSLTIGGLIAFNMYAQKLVLPLLKTSSVLMTLQGVFVSLERLENFLQEPEVVVSAIATSDGINQDNNVIDFQNVNFAYEEKPILSGITMTFKPSMLNVIVGESGCGKSTLTLLMYRIWEAQSGAIRINAYDHKNYDMKYLRNCISVVSQDSYLFNDTILNNIVMDEVHNMEFVYECAKTACIHEFILTLPDQYESVVGDKGVKLSGGEKQRICLARALVRKAPILILDEATSALDQLTEKQVLENVVKQMGKSTIIMITHRLHSVIDANSIYVMKDGKVVAQGKHHELMEHSTYYKNIFERNIELIN